MGVSSAGPKFLSSEHLTRTRIKICGLTRDEDVRTAVAAGVDAIGLVFYPPSPRALAAERARELCTLIPPFVTVVGLFVNPEPEWVREVLQQVPLQLLQFHGDEHEEDCIRYGLPYIKAARMRQELDLINYASCFPSARGFLLDAFVDGYGGGGKVFDWDLVPSGFTRPLILSGGLDPENVGEAIRRVGPVAVDVSTGVECAKGIKDAGKIARFVAGVRDADG